MAVLAIPPPSDIPWALISICLLAAIFTFRGVRLLLRPCWSELRKLPHPKSGSLLWGNVREIRREEAGEAQLRWERELGPVYSYRQLLSRWRFCTTDPRALAHITQHAYLYPKPSQLQRSLIRTLGAGLLLTEGDVHRRQRRVMNPCFSPQQLRALVPVFWDKAAEMADIWERLIDASASSEKTGLKGTLQAGEVVNAYRWLSRATLDIIGLAGFGYAFESLTDESNELAQAVSQLFRVPRMSAFAILRTMFPFLRYLPVQSNRVQENARAVMRRVGMELVTRKKEAVLRSVDGKRDEKDVGKKMVAGQDLLSALVRANMAADVPASQKLDDEEVLAQISTFLLAGHETTSTAVTWALYALSTHQEVQTKLREELLSYPDERPDSDALNTIPYLDAVVREVMRVHSPVSNTIRVAAADDEVPLSQPYTDTKGNVRTSVILKKGDGVMIPIKAVNRSLALWGPDADLFRPERWLQPLPEGAAHVPGVWAHTLSFLGGPRACIGYRFSVLEIKVFLYTLLRRFTFELGEPGMQVEARATIVTRPVLKGRAKEGPMMPLRIKKVVEV